MEEVRNLQQGLDEVDPQVAPLDVSQLVQQDGFQLSRIQFGEHRPGHKDRGPPEAADGGTHGERAQAQLQLMRNRHPPAALIQKLDQWLRGELGLRDQAADKQGPLDQQDHHHKDHDRPCK